MLQRLLCKSLNVKVCDRQINLLFKLPQSSHSCERSRIRLFSSQKVSALRNNYERTLFLERDVYFVKPKYYSSQVDARKKNDPIETVKDKTVIATTKKINVKLKPSELKRLLSLAEPEKWTLAGKY